MGDKISAKESLITVLKLKRPSLVTNSNTSCGLGSFSYPNNVGREPKRATVVGRRMFFSFICFDKKDVRIKHHRSHSRMRIEHHHRATIKAKGETGCKNMERKLQAILTWDAIPKPYDDDDDVASDASSDLFEIESIIMSMSQKHPH